MVTSNYSTPQLPEVQTQTPVTPVNTSLIKAVEGTGEVLIGMRKQQNEAIDQKFLEAGAEYFKNVSTEISSDESRKTAMLFAALESGESKGTLSAEGAEQLKKFRADFGDLEAAAAQGTISKLQLQTRAQAMLTKAVAARPDLGDEVRKVATDILGADVTKASELLYSEMMKIGLEAGKEQDDVFNDRLKMAQQFVSYSSDQQSTIYNLTQAQKLGNTPEGRAYLAKAESIFGVDVNGFEAARFKDSDDISNQVDVKLSGPDFTNRLYSTDSQIASEARNEAIASLQILSEQRAGLMGMTGINSGQAKSRADRISSQMTFIQAQVDAQGDPIKQAQVASSQAQIRAMTAMPAAKDAYARARPAGDAGKADEALINSASIGETVKSQASKDGYIRHDINLGPRDYEGYKRLPVLWNVSEAATPSALAASVEITDMIFAGYYIDRVNAQTGEVYAPALGETKVVFSSLNMSHPNMIAQLEESADPLLVKEMTLTRMSVWDRAMLYAAQRLPEPYRSDYEPPDTAEEGFTGNKWYAGRYKGQDKEGFQKALGDVFAEMGTAEIGRFITHQRAMDALYRTKVGE
jgi:hypothetical protein